MKKIESEILESAAKINAMLYELTSEKGEKLRLEAIRKFAKDDSHLNFIWSNLPDRSFASCRESNAWLLIDSFIRDENNVLMFFNYSDELSVFQFSHGHDVIPVLSECSDFEYYLTNQELDYLLCFNHHDSLIAAGTATTWLEALTDENSHLLEPVVSHQ